MAQCHDSLRIHWESYWEPPSEVFSLDAIHPGWELSNCRTFHWTEAWFVGTDIGANVFRYYDDKWEWHNSCTHDHLKKMIVDTSNLFSTLINHGHPNKPTADSAAHSHSRGLSSCFWWRRTVLVRGLGIWHCGRFSAQADRVQKHMIFMWSYKPSDINKKKIRKTQRHLKCAPWIEQQ